MNEPEQSVSMLYERVTQRDYINGTRKCDNCGENKQLFFYSKKKVLCADCILKTIREQMPKAL